MRFVSFDRLRITRTAAGVWVGERVGVGVGIVFFLLLPAFCIFRKLKIIAV